MKKLLSILTFVFLASAAESQTISKTINVVTPGTLSQLLTYNEKTSIIDLIVTGNIDVRDIRCMRDEIINLAVLDLSASSINEYVINYAQYAERYPANQIPPGSFGDINYRTSKISLKKIILPNSLTSIGSTAFSGCIGLTEILIPNNVTSRFDAFIGCSNLIKFTINADNPNYTETDGVLYDKTQTTLIAYPPGKDGLFTIPSSVSTIGDMAFYGCSKIPEFSIPNSVISIGLLSFAYCNSITNLTIPNSVEKIGNSAFLHCDNLKNIIIGSSVNSIGNSAFLFCDSLKEINIPASVTSIGNGVFDQSFSIMNINVDVENQNYSSKEGVLFDKKQTTLVSYPCGKTGSYTIPNIVTRINDYAFTDRSNLTGLIIGDSVKTIGDGAFLRCKNLKGNLTIPASVTSIGDNAFYLTNLVTINNLNDIPQNLGNQAFNLSTIVFVPLSANFDYKNSSQWNIFTILSEKRAIVDNPNAGELSAKITAGYGTLSSITHLSVSGNLNNMDLLQIRMKMTNLIEIDMSGVSFVNNTLADATFQNKTMLTSVKLPSSLTSIGKSVFSGCTSLSGEIPISQSIVYIGDSAFMNCHNLTGNLVIPNLLENIGTSVFSGCSGLTGTLVIPNSVNSIKNFAFYGCSGISKIILGNSVNLIFNESFNLCSSLLEFSVDINNQSFSSFDGILYNKNQTILISYPAGRQGPYLIPNSVSSINSYAFFNCKGLIGSLVIPNSISKIQSKTFFGCTGISELIIPNSVTTIGDFAFYGCSGLKSLNIPASVTSIESLAFANCTGLTGRLVIPNSISSIKYGLFSGCSGLTGLTIPNSITKLEGWTFKDCKGLTGSLIIPNSVTYLSGNDFSGCTGLTGLLTIPSSVNYIGPYTFQGCTGISSVCFPNSINSINEYTFSDCTGLTNLSIPKSINSINETAFNNCSGLKKISVEHKVPFTITANTFKSVIKEACILEIPIGAGYTYMTTDYWSDFINLTEKDFNVYTNSNIPISNSVKVYNSPSEIIIEGTINGEIVKIYSVNGIRLQTVISKGGNLNIPLERNAVYLVKTSKETFKVML